MSWPERPLSEKNVTLFRGVGPSRLSEMNFAGLFVPLLPLRFWNTVKPSSNLSQR